MRLYEGVGRIYQNRGMDKKINNEKKERKIINIIRAYKNLCPSYFKNK